MKLPANNKQLSVILIIIVISSVLLINAVQAAAKTTNEQDLEDDAPVLVAKDYMDEKINELMEFIEELWGRTEEQHKLISDLGKQVEDLKKQAQEIPKASIFELVELEEGQILTAGAGTEIIVRGGKATAISGKNGDGLADITSGDGIDIGTGQEVPVNHLLVASRDDGRGIKAESSIVYVLLKGICVIE